MNQRYFRTADESLYEQVRLGLDAAWGHPSGGTITCIDPVAVAPRDNQGRVLLAVNDQFCGYAEVQALLPGLLASGAVAEITEAEYHAAFPQTP